MAWSGRLLLRVALVLVIGGVAAARFARRSPHPAAPPPESSSPLVVSLASSPPPPPHRAADLLELGLVAPLVPGSDLAGFTVREILGVERGSMRVVCAKARAVVRLEVALADPGGASPPATAGRYAVYYSLRGATPEDGERLSTQLAAVIKKNATAPPPPGMTPFSPEPRPGTVL